MNWKMVSSIIGSIVLISAFAGIAIRFDNTYAKEIVVVETLQQFQLEQRKSQTTYELKSDYRFYAFRYETLTSAMYKYKRLVREHPNDQDLKLDYDEIVEQRKFIKQKMDNILEKIK
jgi:hypothetical protein